jgi:hypothetical protein
VTALESRRVREEVARPPAFDVFPVRRWNAGPPAALEDCRLEAGDAGVRLHPL